jgi:membrane fusion protein, heavy metal efflux system
MRLRFLCSYLLLHLLDAPIAFAASPLGCLIEPSQVADLGSPVIGVLDKVLVDRGASIKKGQVLATLRTTVEQASLDVAKSRARAEADVRAAIASRDFSRQQAKRAEELVKHNFISRQALDQALSESEVAEQRLAQAREQKQIWDKEHDLAEAQLALRNLLSPLTGVVLDRYLSPGERVEERPVMRIATLDPLRVEVFMPAASYGSVKTGMTATVSPELPGIGERRARVSLVDRVIDPASNTFRVRLDLPNPGHAIPAGVRCNVALADQVVGADPTRSLRPKTPGPERTNR